MSDTKGGDISGASDSIGEKREGVAEQPCMNSGAKGPERLRSWRESKSRGSKYVGLRMLAPSVEVESG